jgi:serine/threonine protein kinase
MMTSQLRGTPVYCAPELLINPYKLSEIETTVAAQSSRKTTDRYAFAMVMWEMFANEKPFKDIRNDLILASGVHTL